MRFRTLVLALALCSGTGMAADKHPKPPKPTKHAAPVVAKHDGTAIKPFKYKGKTAAKHAKPPKPIKHKARKAPKH